MPTHAHRSIKHCLDMLAPFEASDKQLEQGQLEFYQFMLSIYQGMYRNPEEYMVFPGPYEDYTAKAKDKPKESTEGKRHSNDSRESTLRNTFQQAIQFYALYFFNLGIESTGLDDSSGALIIPKITYDNVLTKMNRFHDSKNNAKRYELLSSQGLQVNEINDVVYISHSSYKKAMQGLQYLTKAPDSKYRLMNYLRLDYKNAYSPVPAVDDIKKTLPSRYAEIINKLEASLAGMKVKAKIKPLRGIVSDFEFQNINDFAGSLYKEDYSLFKWFANQLPERLCKCPSNRRVRLGEETRRICGLSNRTETVNPNDSDIENAIYIMKKFRNI